MMDELNTELMRISESCWPKIWDFWALMFLKSELSNTDNENGCHQRERFLLRTHHIRVRLVFPPNWWQTEELHQMHRPNGRCTKQRAHLLANAYVNNPFSADMYYPQREQENKAVSLWSHARNSQHVFGDFSPPNNTLRCVYLRSKCERLNLQ